MQNEYYEVNLGNERGFDVDKNIEMIEFVSFEELVEYLKTQGK